MSSLDLSVPEAFRPENEVPKSPCIAPPTHCKYLIWGGSSNPNSRLKAATVSSVAACPKIACPKSPGSISIAEKIITETIKRVASPKPSRPRTVFKTGCKSYYLILKINMGPLLGPIILVSFYLQANHQRSVHLPPSLSQLAAMFSSVATAFEFALTQLLKIGHIRPPSSYISRWHS